MWRIKFDESVCIDFTKMLNKYKEFLFYLPYQSRASKIKDKKNDQG